MIHPLIEEAYAVLDGAALSRELAKKLAEEIHGAELLDLISLANKVRSRFAPEILCCSILNAKSGKCSQNCKFCAQSAHHHTAVETYPLVSRQTTLDAARKVYENGVRSFGYVTSGHGYPEADAEFMEIMATLDAIHQAFPDMKLCVSLGVLGKTTARLLAEHHCGRYNMNLQTAPGRYRELISDTHTIEEKIQTIKWLQELGVEICCGGILGLGETMTDRLEMAFAIRELNVDGIPLNVLLPIPGTPLEQQPLLEPAEAAKTFALFRLINPTKMIKLAAGRETVMKDFQGLLMLSGPNSLMTGGYLTTRGRSVEEDKDFMRHLAAFGNSKSEARNSKQIRNSKTGMSKTSRPKAGGGTDSCPS